MPDYLGDEMRKVKKDEPEKEEKEIKCNFFLFVHLFFYSSYLKNDYSLVV